MKVPRRASPARKQEVEARIRDALAALRPLMGIDSCDLSLTEYEDGSGVAVLRVEGGCKDCEMSADMLMQGITVNLRARVPEIRGVRLAGSAPADR